MQTFIGLKDVRRSLRSPVITIGNFDGVHRGHQVLFQKLKERAKEINGESVVMTFHPHPLEVLFPGKGPLFITSHEQKLKLIAESGVDAAIVIPFDSEFSRLTAREFVSDVLVGIIGVRVIIVGHDYRFGRGREGDIDLLLQLGKEFGFDVEMVAGIRMDDEVVSSTVIRELILKGNVKRAGALLGRRYEIRGPVVAGRHRGGKLLGFPTANVCMPKQASPHTGVYVVEAEVNGKWYGGAANLGYNPTFGDSELCLEVHLFDFNEEIYGVAITVRFIDRLREEKRFSGPDELSAQIRKDVEKAKKILSAVSRKEKGRT